MKLLQWLGATSLCCNAPFHYKQGWDPKVDGWVCSVCGVAKAHNTSARKRTETLKTVSRNKMKQEAEIKRVEILNKNKLR